MQSIEKENNMPICTNCDTPLQEGVAFCPKCGTPAPQTTFKSPYGNELVHTAKRSFVATHPWINATLIILAIFGVIGIIACASAENGTAAMIAALVFTLIVAAIYALMLWSNATFRYEIYGDRIIYTGGLLNKKRDVYTLRPGADTRFEQSFLGGIFNYGDILVGTPGYATYYLYHVKRPHDAIKAIESIYGYKK